MMEFREIIANHWKPVTRVDALRYLGQETNEARDAWMRITRDHARNNHKRVTVEEELVDVVIMGATLLGSKPGWEPNSEIIDITTDLDDLCSLAASAMDMYRWRELFAGKDVDTWWAIDTERTVLGAIAALGDSFHEQFVRKLNYLVTKHVPPQERESVVNQLPWLMEPSDA